MLERFFYLIRLSIGTEEIRPDMMAALSGSGDLRLRNMHIPALTSLLHSLPGLKGAVSDTFEQVHVPFVLRKGEADLAPMTATSPKLLLLDEPAAGMNPQETLELASFIHDIRDKYHLTILLIEHHMDLVMNISDRIYVLDFGSLIAHGLPAEIQKNQHVIDAYLGVVEDE